MIKIPTFFTDERLDLFTQNVKALLIWGGPLIMILVALFFAEDILVMIVELFRKKKDSEKEQEEDFEIRRY